MREQAQSNRYVAYLIRCWYEEGDGWRGTLEDPHTGERHAFANMNSLLNFIETQTTGQLLPSPPETKL